MTTKVNTRFNPGPILMLAGIMFVTLLARIIFSPLLLRIESDLGLSHSEAATFFLLTSLGYCVTMVFSGYISHRITHRTVIIVSAAICGATLFVVGLSSSLWMIRIGLLFLGAGSGLYLPSGVATIYQSVDSRHWGKAIGIHELGPSASFIAAPVLAQFLVPLLSWRGLFVVLGVISLLLGTTFALVGRGGRFRGAKPNLHSLRELFSHPSAAFICIYFALVGGSAIGVFSILPTYLATERAMTEDSVNMLMSVSRLSGPFMVFFAGWMIDRTDVRMLFVGLFVALSVLTGIIGLAHNFPLTLVVFIQPLLNSAFFPTAFALLARAVPSELRNIAVSIAVSSAYLFGGGVVPTVMGILGESGNFWLGFVLLGGLLLACLFLLPFSKISKLKMGHGGEN